MRRGLPRAAPMFRMRILKAGLALGICLAAPAAASTDLPLFESNEVMDITIPVDFGALCRPREDENCGYVASELEYRGVDGATRTVPMEIKIRGGWRSLTRHCSAPLLWVRFDGEKTAGTPFEGLATVPLTTHCGRGFSVDTGHRRTSHSDWEQYLLREYLGYRLYRLLTDHSVRARLLRITYLDPEKAGRKIRNYAFMTEHFDSVAARTGTEVLPRGSFDASSLDAEAAGQLSIWEYMIGNTDWSIARERNIVLLGEADGRQLPVPYDLDMAGLVNAAYAGPAPSLPINEVRQRYFLGYCQPGTDWDALFERFLAAEQDILALPGTVPDLDSSSRRWVARFLRQFFEIVHSPGKRRDKIVDACKPWPPSATDHTSPEAEG